MFIKLLRKIFGSRNDRILKVYGKKVRLINALAASMAELTDEALKNKTDEFKGRFAAGESLDDLLLEACCQGGEYQGPGYEAF
jgi:preprotein translocase subunit SecA